MFDLIKEYKLGDININSIDLIYSWIADEFKSISSTLQK